MRGSHVCLLAWAPHAATALLPFLHGVRPGKGARTTMVEWRGDLACHHGRAARWPHRLLLPRQLCLARQESVLDDALARGRLPCVCLATASPEGLAYWDCGHACRHRGRARPVDVFSNDDRLRS